MVKSFTSQIVESSNAYLEGKNMRPNPQVHLVLIQNGKSVAPGLSWCPRHFLPRSVSWLISQCEHTGRCHVLWLNCNNKSYVLSKRNVSQSGGRCTNGKCQPLALSETVQVRTTCLSWESSLFPCPMFDS